MLWDFIPVPKGTDADFAVAVTDDSLAPWSKRAARHISGGAPSFTTATSGFLKRTEGSSSGSSAPTAAARCISFAVNRAHAEDDRMIPPDKAAELVCYGRLELKKPIPLPMD